MGEKRNLFFVYGILRPDYSTGAKMERDGELDPVGRATIVGDMYATGIAYVTNIGGEDAGKVHGWVIKVDDDQMRTFDGIEGYNERTHTGHYLRVRTTATLIDTGEPVEVWVYDGQRGLGSRSKVESGDWFDTFADDNYYRQRTVARSDESEVF